MAKVYFKYSCMGAGKTALACITAFNYQEQGLKPLCISSALDTRFGEAKEDMYGFRVGKWESRIEGLSREVFLLPEGEMLTNFCEDFIDNYGYEFGVIIVDEAQFLSAEQVEDLFRVALYWDIPVICYGLLTTFKTTLFEGSKRLIELGAKLEHIKSVGTDGESTVINGKFIKGKLVTDGDVIDIGGDEKYKAMTLRDYWAELNKASWEKLNNKKIFGEF